MSMWEINQQKETINCIIKVLKNLLINHKLKENWALICSMEADCAISPAEGEHQCLQKTLTLRILMQEPIT